MFNPEKFTNYATNELHQYCATNKIQTMVTGISGGLDSAVVLALCQIVNKMSNDNIKNIGVSLPIFNNNEKDFKDSITMSKLVLNKFASIAITFPETNMFTEIVERLKGIDQILNEVNLFDINRNTISIGNIAARTRMITLYYIANLTNGMVMSTDNYSEFMTGFWTIHGDVGDYGLIQQLWKGIEVVELAKYLEVPEDIINLKPTDGLGVTNGGDEEQLGAPYPIVDDILQKLLIHMSLDCKTNNENEELPKLEEYDNELVMKIAKRAFGTSYKRKGQIILKRNVMQNLGIFN